MKNLNYFILYIIGVFLASCQVNQSVEKKLDTGEFSRGNGITCDENLIYINNKLEKRNQFIYGEKVEISFKNVKGFKIENGKSFPEMSMFILKNNKDTVFQLFNMLSDVKDGTEISPLTLKAHFVAALPHENNEKYRITILIWDKKSNASYLYEMPFTVENNNMFKIKSKNIKYSGIYLWDNTQQLVVVDKKLDIKHEYVLIYEGIEGLAKVNNRVFPSLSAEIIDKDGHIILPGSNLLEQYRESGSDIQEVYKQITVNITFKMGNIHNPCILKSSIMDLKSDNKVELEAELELY